MCNVAVCPIFIAKFGQVQKIAVYNDERQINDNVSYQDKGIGRFEIQKKRNAQFFCFDFLTVKCLLILFSCLSYNFFEALFNINKIYGSFNFQLCPYKQ